MNPRAVIFDLDGTLIDSVPDVRHALNRALALHGRPALSLAVVRGLVGEGARVMLTRALELVGGAQPDLDALLHDYLSAYAAEPVIDTVVYDGGRAALERLAAQAVPLAICTNKPSAITRLVLERLALSPFFGAVLGADDVPNRKPDGRHVTATLAALGIEDPAGTVYVGDSETDVAAARAAGVPMVAVSFGYCGDGADRLGADRVIDHYDALDAAVRELAG